jgi:two-component system, cell cycle response regulator DivK
VQPSAAANWIGQLPSHPPLSAVGRVGVPVPPKGLDISCRFLNRSRSSFNKDEIKFVYSPVMDVTAMRNMESDGASEDKDSIDQQCILIVDDEPLNLKLFTLTLIRRGYRVLQASDGFHAFVLAHDHRPDLIVMDVQLPEISGLEVTRTLKDSIYTKNIPIVIATAFLIDEEKILECGCDGYIAKPYAMKDFIDLIGSLIARTRRGS